MILRPIQIFWGTLLVLIYSACAVANAADTHRFYYEGDGHIRLVSQKSQHRFAGAYRQISGRYDETAYKRICGVFGAPYNPQKTGLSLRLIAFLDFLQDHFNPGAQLTITSGYRSPVYNTKLRQSGRLAAKASLHQYGMAADFKMAGVSSEHIWKTVKSLGFGGTGYYHGETLHVDVGPARSWDETTSGVGADLSDDNKLIGLVTDFDRYGPGTMLTLGFIRMTAFPIGVVPEFLLERVGNSRASTEVLRFSPTFVLPIHSHCPQLDDIAQMTSIQWRLPASMPSGRYTVSARFCNPSWEKMPSRVVTPVFEVVLPDQ